MAGNTVSGKKRAAEKGDRTGWFRFYASILVPLLSLVSKRTIIDGDKLPRSGAYILTPNHFSNIDPLVIAVAVYKLRRAPRFLAKASLFKAPVLKTVLKKTGQIRVERTHSANGAQPLKEAAQIIEQQSVVIVYPEGTLTRDPDLWPMRGKTGAVRLARAANIPIIPVAHWGTNDLMPRYGKLRLFPRTKIRIKIGDPYFLPDHGSAEQDAKMLVKDTELVMDKITELLAELRQEQAPTRRWNPSEHGQNETGKF